MAYFSLPISKEEFMQTATIEEMSVFIKANTYYEYAAKVSETEAVLIRNKADMMRDELCSSIIEKCKNVICA